MKGFNHLLGCANLNNTSPHVLVCCALVQRDIVLPEKKNNNMVIVISVKKQVQIEE